MDENIDLGSWKIRVGGAVGTEYVIPAGTIISKDINNNFLTLVSDNGITLTGDSEETTPRLVINIPPAGGSVDIDLIHPSGVVVDHFEKNFDPDPPVSIGAVPPAPLPTISENFQRPGNETRIDATTTVYMPAIDEFQKVDVTASPSDASLGTYPDPSVVDIDSNDLDNGGEGGQIVLNNTGELHSLGELFYVPKVANNDTTDAKLIEKMEGQPSGDSDYRLSFMGGSETPNIVRRVLQNLTLRTGLNDRDSGGNLIDNDGDGYQDVVLVDPDGDGTFEPAPSSMLEARVPGLININTAPYEVLEALHYYYQSGTDNLAVDVRDERNNNGPFQSMKDFLEFWYDSDKTRDETGDIALPPPPNNVGSPDGLTKDNEQKLFHFTNVANLISVRSDVFVVYITVQAYRDGASGPDPIGQPLRTMTIVDRSFCLRPNGTLLEEIPLPRILSQTTIP